MTISLDHQLIPVLRADDGRLLSVLCQVLCKHGVQLGRPQVPFCQGKSLRPGLMINGILIHAQ